MLSSSTAGASGPIPIGAGLARALSHPWRIAPRQQENETPLQGWHRTKTIISRPAHRRQFSRPWRGTGRTWSAWSTLAAALVRENQVACAGPGVALCATLMVWTPPDGIDVPRWWC